jgi:DNA-binding transcriptional LysR family regulator
MDLRQLRYLVAVAEEGSFIAAAERLRLAQPALSRQIKALEVEVGHELFHRGARGVALTAAGIAAIDVSRRTIEMLAQAVLLARASGTGTSGKVSLAVGTRMITQGHAADIAGVVHDSYPGIELVISELTFKQMWSAVESGEADIGVGTAAPAGREGLESETLRYDMFDTAALPAKHPLALRDSVSIAELANETLLVWDDSLGGFETAFDAELRKVGVAIPKRERFDDSYDLVTAIRAGRGWAVIENTSKWAIEPDAHGVRLADLQVPFPESLVTRRGRAGPAVTQVINVIRAVLKGEKRKRKSRASIPGDVLFEQIEFRHLRYYGATIEAGSLGKAASDLGVTQPALSRQIRELERLAGATLVERESRGVRPNAAGLAFHEQARRVLAAAQSMIPEIERAARTPAYCIIAGVPTLAVQRLLEQLLQQTEAIGYTSLQFLDLPGPKQIVALRSAEIDIGVCHAAPALASGEDAIRKVRLVEDQLNCALLPAADPRARNASVSLAELADLPFAFFARSFYPELHDAVYDAFALAGFRPRVDGTYDGARMLWGLVRQGQGWTLGLASQADEPPGGTVAVRLSDFAIPFDVNALVRSNETRAPVLLILESLTTIALGD